MSRGEMSNGTAFDQETQDPAWSTNTHSERTLGLYRITGGLPEGAEVSEVPEGDYDFVHFFVQDSGEFASLGLPAIEAVRYDGLLWISYPRPSSKVETDLSRDVMWELVADMALRPVAQVSIDPVWSALRFRPSDEVGK
jgi:hypothetical protein